MAKIIVTESQIFSIIRKSIPDMNILLESDRLLSLNDLAEILSRTGVMKEILEELLIKEFKRGGDEAIIKLFRDSVGLEIDNIRKGRYVFK